MARGKCPKPWPKGPLADVAPLPPRTNARLSDLPIQNGGSIDAAIEQDLTNLQARPNLTAKNTATGAQDAV